MVAERSGWASLLPDLLELVFRVLDSRDLLVCASVCRSWRRHLNRDTRWLPHLAVRLGIDNETLQAQLHALPSLGVLSIKDLLFMACFEQRGKELFALAWFRNFPYHPLRHGALRLAWAYATHRRGLLCLLGYQPYSLDARLAHLATVAHRTRRFDGVDRAVRTAVYTALTLLIGLATVCIFPLTRNFVAWQRTPLGPVQLALCCAPLAAIAGGLLVPHTEMLSLAIVAALCFCLRHSPPSWLLASLPVAAAMLSHFIDRMLCNNQTNASDHDPTSHSLLPTRSQWALPQAES